MAIAAMRVPTIFTAVDKFSAVVSKMAMSTSAFGKTAEAAAMRSSRRFNSAGTSMLTAGVVMAAGIGYVANEAMKFEDKMANINTILNVTPGKLNDIKESIFKVGKETGVPLSDLVSNFYELSSAQIYGAKANEALRQSARLSVLGLGDMTQSTNIMISVLNGFKKEGLSAVDVTEKIARAVQKGKLKVSDMNQSFAENGVVVGLAGVKLDEYLAMQAAMTTAGMPISQSQNALGLAALSFLKMGPKVKKVADSMNVNPAEIVKLQAAQQGLMKGMGMKSGEDIIKKMGGMVPAMLALTAQAKKLGIPISSVFGRKGAIVANAILTGTAFKEYGIEMDYLAQKGLNVADAMYKVKHTTQFKFNILKNEAKELAIRLGDALLPKINELISSTMSTIRGVMEWAKNNKWLASTIFSVALILLKLGVIAKVGAFLFYGLSKSIAFVTWISEAYVAISSLYEAALLAQAFSGAALTTVMGGLAVSMLAVYLPVILIVAALGGLAYILFGTSDATESMASKQISALEKSNGAWKNSTNVMNGELIKQKALMETHNPNVISARGTTDKPMIALLGRLHQNKTNTDINNAWQVKQRDKLSQNAPALQMTNVNGVMSISGGMPLSGDTDKPKNLAGSSQGTTNELLKNMTKQQVEVYLKGDTDMVSGVKGASVVGGITPRLSSTKHGN